MSNVDEVMFFSLRNNLYFFIRFFIKYAFFFGAEFLFTAALGGSFLGESVEGETWLAPIL